MEAAIFDLDGVIADVSGRIEKALRELGKENLKELSREDRRRFWEIFLNPELLELDKPRMDVIDYMRKIKDKGLRIIIVTGRTIKQKNETLKQLSSWGVPYDEIYFRMAGDLRKDSIYKREVVKLLLRRGYSIVEVWEDSDEVIRELRKLIPDAKIVKIES
ncbi:HAD family acid phosphatase [Candidatus Culexarchaeum yellowstonense]|uniref:phosphatase domain-containing protein n=1 Tax=Candidatus Culexarchaeum yellowstonense TaxID=2928963 RepID=UPI0026F177E2|nr:HAD family acid phosphatase [Candidatus Culexarchaeum yellowstonense]